MNKIKKFLIILLKPKFMFIMLKYRVAAGVEHLKLLKSLGSMKTVIDVGSNRGQFSIIARYCYPNAKIIAFEPLKEASLVYKSIFKKDKDVTLYEFAIGEKIKNEVLHITAKDDSSSLLSLKLQKIMFPKSGNEIRQIKVRVFNLSSILKENEIQSPSLLKIDVQGYELNVLKGAGELISKFNFIYVECSFVELYENQNLITEIIDFLYHKNFMLIGIYNIIYKQGKTIQADFLFKNISTTN